MNRGPHLRALEGAAPRVFWLDDPTAPSPEPALSGTSSCDLAVVGGGFTGLWTALLARERNPALDVVVLESRNAGWAASGRNGGFCDASLTHGFANGLTRFPDELGTLERLGLENLDAIETAVRRWEIDCHWERGGGTIDAATAPWQLEELEGRAPLMQQHGYDLRLLGTEALRAEVDSPTYRGGLWVHGRTAMVHPARLAWGLRRACLEMGVRIFEHTRVLDVGSDRGGVVVRTRRGRLRARRLALATNAFPPLLRRLRFRMVPVYDYVLVTEPLSDAQLAEIGWRHRQGLTDSGNQFHYYRLTADSRVLWGGYDAIYHYASRVDDSLDQRAASFALLAEQFFQTFPQLEGVRFTHRWGGAIDTCSRFCAFWGRSLGGRAVHCLGYTGLGVGASRFGAEVMLDLLDGADTERTRLRMVRTQPLPFPPEPARFAGIQLTRWSLARADRNSGRRNLWLRALDRVELGFDS
ncbi:MAG: FAD-dependent oxidoreductase [Candidatus Dormiibacterota bacterium]